MSTGLQQQILMSYDKSYDKNASWINIWEDCAKTYDKPILESHQECKDHWNTKSDCEVCGESLLQKRECFFCSFPEPMC